MARKYRTTVFAVKWNGKNIAEVEEVAGEKRFDWEGSYAKGMTMRIRCGDDNAWLLLPLDWYLVRQLDGTLSIQDPTSFVAANRYVGSYNIGNDVEVKEALRHTRKGERRLDDLLGPIVDGEDEEDEEIDDDEKG